MGEPSPPEPSRPKRDALSVLGMVAVAGAAAFTSYSGLDGLAQLAGWPKQLALLLPVTIDAYAMTATRVWLSPARLTRKARSWARGNAIGAIATSVLGNTVFHAAAAHVLSVTWPVVVGISAVPSVVLGLTVHLWHTANDTEPEPQDKDGTPASAEPQPVRAAYPVLGGASAPARPTGSAPGGVSGPARGGAPHLAPSASGAPAAGAPRPRVSAPAPAAGGAGGASRRPAEPPARPADREERIRQLLRTAWRLNAESVNRGDGPVSARRLARELHISQDTAREIIKKLPERRPAVQTEPNTSGDGARQASGAPPAPGQARERTAPDTHPGAPAATAARAPATAPAAPGPATADASGQPSAAPGLSGADTAGGAPAAAHSAPVEHANGAESPSA
jgi:hypothetical protein